MRSRRIAPHFQLPFTPGGVKPKIAIDPSLITISSTDKIYEIKQIWKKEIGFKWDKVEVGKSGRFYLVSRTNNIALGVNSQWKIDGEFKASRLFNIGEGNGKVYAVSREGQLTFFDPIGHELEKKVLLFSTTYWDPSVPLEDPEGRVWVKQHSTIFRVSQDSDKPVTTNLEKPTEKHSFLDRKGNFYTTDYSAHFRVSPDMTIKTIKDNPKYFFLSRDVPYSVIGNKLYRLDFDADIKETDPSSGKEQIFGAKKAVINWDDTRDSMKPAVAKDGTIHLILKNGWKRGGTGGLYVALTPGGRLSYKKELGKKLNLDIESDVDPVVTPRKTIFFIVKKRGTQNHFLYAIDSALFIHAIPLAKKPSILLNGEGEQVIAVHYDGAAQCYETKTLEEMKKEMDLEVRKRDIVSRIGRDTPA